jgi:hypothetical protein
MLKILKNLNLNLGLNLKDPGVQQICANSWKASDNDTRTYFENEAKNINNLKDKESYISNTRVRKASLDKTIQEIRKMVFLKLIIFIIII